MKALILFCILQVSTLLVEGGDVGVIANKFVPCSVNDPQLNQCVKDTAQKFIPAIAHGVPELRIPQLDPLEVPEASFGQKTKDVDIVINYKNIVQRGISDVVIEDAKIDLDKGVMEFDLFYPIFIWEADYEAKGKMFDFSVNGNGKANITVWGSKSTLVINFHVASNHLVKDSVQVTYDFEKLYLDYSNMRVNDDDELSASAGTFINENSREILNGFKPDLEKFYGKLLDDHLNGFFETIPYSILFKE